jgi:hypothetical protein
VGIATVCERLVTARRTRGQGVGTTMRTRTAAVCAVVLVTAATAGGCGVRDPHAADKPGATTAQATPDDGDGGALAGLFRGLADKASGKQSAQMVQSVQNPGRTVVMSGVQSWGAHPGLDMTMPPSALGYQNLNHAATMEMRLVGGAYYYQVEPQPRGPLKGKHWMKVSASALYGKDGQQALNQAVRQDPTSGLRYLAYADDITTVGNVTVDGKRTTHYKGTSAVSDESEKLLLGGSDKVSVDVWVDSAQLPVRITEVLAHTTITIDFKSFGGGRRITVPPAADTADLSAQVAAKLHVPA